MVSDGGPVVQVPVEPVLVREPLWTPCPCRSMAGSQGLAFPVNFTSPGRGFLLISFLLSPAIQNSACNRPSPMAVCTRLRVAPTRGHRAPASDPLHVDRMDLCSYQSAWLLCISQSTLSLSSAGIGLPDRVRRWWICFHSCSGRRRCHFCAIALSYSIGHRIHYSANTCW